MRPFFEPLDEFQLLRPGHERDASPGRIIGADGIPVVQAFGLQALDNAPNYALRSTEIIGPDVLTWWSRAD